MTTIALIWLAIGVALERWVVGYVLQEKLSIASVLFWIGWPVPVLNITASTVYWWWKLRHKRRARDNRYDPFH